jgi:mannose-6-phosphate isomerase-like protein (cupin superfamily)
MVDDRIQTFDVADILRSLPHLNLAGETTTEDVDAFPMQAPFGTGGLFIGGFTGQSPWECHTDMDELLYAVEGEVEVTILTESGAQRGTLHQGHACIVPRGLWHRQFARSAVKLLTISGPGPVSWADDPRAG